MEENGKLRVALATTDEERRAVFRLRYEVYTSQMNLYKDVANHDDRVLVDPEDEGARLYMALLNDKLVGAVRGHIGRETDLPASFEEVFQVQWLSRFVDPRDLGILTRFTVLPEHRGGVASFSLVRQVYLDFAAAGVELGLLDCIPELVNLYKSLGFRPYAPLCRDVYTGFLVPMMLMLGDVEHMEAMRSPLFPLTKISPPQHPRNEPLLAEVRKKGPILSEIDSCREAYRQVLCSLCDGENSATGFTRNMTDEQIKALLEKSHLIFFPKHYKIISAGTMGRSVYLLLKGKAEAKTEGRLVRVIESGEIFGEIAYLLGRARTADVYSSEEGTVVLCLDERSLRRHSRRNPELGCRLYEAMAIHLARRLAEPATSGEKPQ